MSAYIRARIPGLLATRIGPARFIHHTRGNVYPGLDVSLPYSMYVPVSGPAERVPHQRGEEERVLVLATHVDRRDMERIDKAGAYGLTNPIKVAPILADPSILSAKDRKKVEALRNQTLKDMVPSAINAELDYLEKLDAQIGAALIAMGRGHDTPVDTRRRADEGDTYAVEATLVRDLIGDRHREIELRYGPNAPARLPRGFGPRKR
jgi:hypothetical protein